MALRLIYQMFSKLLGWIVLRTQSDTSKEIEILVLRLWVPRTPPPSLNSTFRGRPSAARSRASPVGFQNPAHAADQR